MSEKIYGLMAEFDSPAEVLRAAEKVRDAGFRLDRGGLAFSS